MLKKGILLSAVLLVLLCSTAEARRDIVVPTYYGYGVVSAQAMARPYITGYYPYAWPAYGYSGYNPTAPMPTAYGAGLPAWNGSYWYYGGSGFNGSTGSLAAVTANLNIRSEPYVAGKKNRNSNVIGSLNTGEHVHILGQKGNWSFIQSAYMPLRRGYVYTSYLRSYNNSYPQSHYTAFYPQMVSAW